MSKNPSNNDPINSADQQMADRKSDHINMAFNSQVKRADLDSRFIYEPMLSGHKSVRKSKPNNFAGKTLDHPIWVSSMTGGTVQAKNINLNLARVAKEFGLGMGLGSCRPLLESKDRWSDFDIRATIGTQPLLSLIHI